VNATNVTAIFVALIGVAGTIGGIYLARRISEVHVLVNKQLSDVMDRLEKVTGERDTARTERDESRRR